VERTPAVLVVNTRARDGAEMLEAARRAVEACGLPLADVVAVQEPDRMESAVTLAADAGARLVIVGGGDGTLSCAANALAGRDVTLGVLPLGTANDFARGLGLGRTLEGACRVLAEGTPKRVDLGQANGRYFLNAASVGLTTVVAAHLDASLKKRLGRLAYPMKAATEAWKLEPFHVRLRTPERTLELDALQVVVANGRFMGGGRITHPDATLDDRLLSVYVVSAPFDGSAGQGEDASPRLQKLWRLGRVGLLLGRGRHLALPEVEHFQTRSLQLETEPLLEVNADGELVGRTPMAFGLAPGALRVLVPSPAPATAPAP